MERIPTVVRSDLRDLIRQARRFRVVQRRLEASSLPGEHWPVIVSLQLLIDRWTVEAVKRFRMRAPVAGRAVKP